MRTFATFVPALVACAALVAAAGCAPEGPEADVGAGPGDGVAAAAEGSGGSAGEGSSGPGETEETVVWVFGVGEQISVELTLHSGEDGGRGTPVFSGYRPTVEFDHLDQSVDCALQLPSTVGSFEPGDTHLVGLECDEEVTVHVDELGFVLTEGGKENGDGEVVLTEM